MSLSFLQSIALADAQRTLSEEHSVVMQPSHFRFTNLAFAVRCGILQINLNPIVTQHVRRKSMGNGVTVSNTASVSQQQIIDSLTAQLAKANERVRELEALAEERAEFIINASNMESANEVYERCKFPLKVAINKFAIEKKIEGIESSIAYAEGKSHFVDVSDLQDYIEQLRKEQE